MWLFSRSRIRIVKIIHLVFIALNVGSADMRVYLIHGLIIAPAADLHGDLFGDSEVSREGSKAVPKLVDGDPGNSGSLTAALDGPS